MYIAVPIIMPVPVRSPSGVRTRAMPKSSSLGTSPSSVSATKMFSGLRSRWTIPALCAAIRPRSAPSITSCTRASSICSGAGRTSSRSAWPRISSITRYSVPSASSPKSNTWHTCLVVSLLTAAASRWKRERAISIAATDGFITLTATSAAVCGLVAR